jgi:hypothetical protein
MGWVMAHKSHSSKKAPVSTKTAYGSSKKYPLSTKKGPAKKTFPLLRVLVIAGVIGIALAVSGFTFAASQEQHDSFCASCHTIPETTFYQRSIAAKPVDMASDHTTHNVRCIDCHSGTGVGGRVSAEMMGAHNAIALVTHTAIQPAPLTVPIVDGNCLKCHQQVTVSDSMDNHFHYFLAKWQSLDKNAAHCVDCHSGHKTDYFGVPIEQNQDMIRTCEKCHNFAGAGG